MLLVAVAVCRFSYLLDYIASLPYADFPIGDARLSDLFAERMLRGHWVHEDYATMPVLYPVLLAVTKVLGLPYIFLYAIQMLLGVGTVLLVYRISAKLFGELAPRTPIVAAALFAFYGPAAFHESKLLGASIGLFFATLAVWLAILANERRARWEIPVGVAAALATLAVAQSVLFAPILSALLVLRRRFAHAAVLLVAFAVPLVPFAVRNGLAGAGWSPLPTQSGAALFHGNHLGARGDYETPEGFAGEVLTMRADERRIAEEATGRSLSVREVSDYFRDLAVRTLVDNPTHALRVIGLKLYRLFMAFEPRLNYSFHAERAEVQSLWLFPVPFSLLIVFGLVGFVMAVRRRVAQAPLAIAAGIAVFTVIAIYVSSRYRLPLSSVVAVWAGFALTSLASARRFKTILAGVVVAGSLLFNPLDDFTKEMASERVSRAPALLQTFPQRALQELRIATDEFPADAVLWARRTQVALLASEIDDAESSLERARALSPHAATVALLAGDIILARDQRAFSRAHKEWRAGLARRPGHRALSLALANSLRRLSGAEKDEAVTIYDSLLSKDARDADAHAGLGHIHLSRGDFEAAQRRFGLAARYSPDSAPHFTNFGFALIKAGRAREAIAPLEEAVAIDRKDETARANLAVARYLATF